MRKLPGACAKQQVVAWILTPSGDLIQGWNLCESPQKKCPREGMARGCGYELCVEICKQYEHAEVHAITNTQKVGIDLKGGILFLYGHEYCCDNCIKFMKAAGLAAYVADGDYFNLVES